EIEIEDVHNYLVSLRYIEELQKFREDDYFKFPNRTSLKLEPDPNVESKNNYQQKKLSYSRFSSHYDIRALQQQSDPSSSSSPLYHQQNQSTLELNNSDYTCLLNKSFNDECLKQKQESSTNGDFKPGHRKTYSLETNLFLSTNNNNHNQCSSSSPSSSPTNNRSSKNLKINLIDDSPILNNNDPIINTYQVSHVYNKRDKKPTLEMLKRKSDDSFLSPIGGFNNLEDWNSVYPDPYERWTYTDKDIIHKGCVSRKTLLKDKKKPPFSFWTNYHLRLTSDSLLFFNSKSNNQLK
ncbi:hypothetical protein BLA29_007568, partial [Euroglyphus maynei]